MSDFWYYVFVLLLFGIGLIVRSYLNGSFEFEEERSNIVAMGEKMKFALDVKPLHLRVEPKVYARHKQLIDDLQKEINSYRRKYWKEHPIP